MAFSIRRASAFLISVAVLVCMGSLPTTVVGQTGSRESLMINSVAGRDLFEFYCATCHGRDGKGAGPVATALRVPPPDLTTLATRYGGVFPGSRIESLVANGPDIPPAHGSTDMPVWGPIFRGLDSNDRLTRVRLRNVVEYLASIQTR
jgi:mono/diheme cytochrome c family protein